MPIVWEVFTGLPERDLLCIFVAALVLVPVTSDLGGDDFGVTMVADLQTFPAILDDIGAMYIT